MNRDTEPRGLSDARSFNSALRGSSVRIALAIVLAGMASAGCQTTPVQPPKPEPLIRNTGKPIPEPPLSADALAATDPCAMRMHDLIGPLFEYYIIHRKLPPKLEDIRGVADLDVVLNFTCTVSGRPYVYMPNGLLDPAMSRRLIVYDPMPAHETLRDGKPTPFRWGIVMTEPKNREPIVMNVVQLTEPQFLLYAPGVNETIVLPPSGGSVPLGGH